jgi:hypothetical protein
LKLFPNSCNYKMAIVAPPPAVYVDVANIFTAIQGYAKATEYACFRHSNNATNKVSIGVCTVAHVYDVC